MATAASRVNVGSTERYLSSVGGGALMLWALGRRTVPALVAGAVGASLVYRGASGRCVLYRALGIDTSGRGCEPQPDRGVVDQVDQSSDMSFPASDSPSWTPTTSVGKPPRRGETSTGG